MEEAEGSNKPAEFDLTDLDAKFPTTSSLGPVKHSRSSQGGQGRRKKPRRISTRRLARARRREIVGGIAITTLVMFLAIALFLTGSCGGPPPEV